jgi:uncharacterized SAM-binding protein YcdF (DUF218 family)
MGIWFWLFFTWLLISTNLITFLLTYLFLQRKMYLLAIKEIILFLTGGGKKEDKREYKQVEKEVEIERQQEEIPKQESPHSFSTSASPSSFSLQDILLKKKK